MTSLCLRIVSNLFLGFSVCVESKVFFRWFNRLFCFASCSLHFSLNECCFHVSHIRSLNHFIAKKKKPETNLFRKRQTKQPTNIYESQQSGLPYSYRLKPHQPNKKKNEIQIIWKMEQFFFFLPPNSIWITLKEGIKYIFSFFYWLWICFVVPVACKILRVSNKRCQANWREKKEIPTVTAQENEQSSMSCLNMRWIECDWAKLKWYTTLVWLRFMYVLFLLPSIYCIVSILFVYRFHSKYEIFMSKCKQPKHKINGKEIGIHIKCKQ